VNGRCHLAPTAGAACAEGALATWLLLRIWLWLLIEQLLPPDVPKLPPPLFAAPHPVPPPCPPTATLADEQPWSLVCCLNWRAKSEMRLLFDTPPALAEALQVLALTGCGIFITKSAVIMPIVAPIRKFVLYISYRGYFKYKRIVFGKIIKIWLRNEKHGALLQEFFLLAQLAKLFSKIILTNLRFACRVLH
jgi:hypothetical protein